MARLLAVIAAYVLSVMAAAALIYVWGSLRGGGGHSFGWAAFPKRFYGTCLVIGVLAVPAFVALRVGLALFGLHFSSAYAVAGALAATATCLVFADRLEGAVIAIGGMAGFTHFFAEGTIFKAITRNYEADKP